ncbi:hypothetical protein V6Z11_D06G109300 [Gossypium hirsutum]
MRIILILFIFQSIVDTQLAIVVLASCSAICSLITSKIRKVICSHRILGTKVIGYTSRGREH